MIIKDYGFGVLTEAELNRRALLNNCVLGSGAVCSTAVHGQVRHGWRAVVVNRSKLVLVPTTRQTVKVWVAAKVRYLIQLGLDKAIAVKYATARVAARFHDTFLEAAVELMTAGIDSYVYTGALAAGTRWARYMGVKDTRAERLVERLPSEQRRQLFTLLAEIH